ncbi:unnamed protein product, partial [Oppiella nova]
MYGKTHGFIQSGIKDLNDLYIQVSKTQDMSTEIITENPNNWTLEGNRGDDITEYINTYLVGAQINTTTSDELILIPWYNKEATHSLPVSINFLYQTLLDKYFKDKPTIKLYNHPILSDQSSDTMEMVMVTMIITCLLLVPLTVPFIGASYVLFPIHERITNSKLLQLMNGISIHTFWAASYVWDLINHLMASVLLLFLFAIFDSNKVFMGNATSIFGLFILFFAFGLSAIPLAYLFSLRLKLPSTGFAILVVIYLLTGVALSVTVFIVGAIKPNTLEVLSGIASILPVYAMSRGIQKLYKLGSYQAACKQMSREHLERRCKDITPHTSEYYGCCESLCRPKHQCYDELNVFQWDHNGISSELTYLIVTGAVYLLLLWLIEGNWQRIRYMFRKQNGQTPDNNDQVVAINMGTGSVQNPSVQEIEDSDVKTEKLRIDGLVNTHSVNSEALVVRNLTKTFGKVIPIQAVNGLSFGVHPEECFGLLGVNGAGKTTTFRMLTGDET